MKELQEGKVRKGGLNREYQISERPADPPALRPACPAGRPPASAGPVPETPRAWGPVRAEVLFPILLAQAKEALARGEACSDPIIKAQEFHDAGESLVILARDIALADRRARKERRRG